MRTLARRVMLLAPAAAVVSCRSPNPALFTLAPVPGVARPGGPRVVLLHQIALARYLERPEIVRSSENYRLDVLANEIWGEPLGPMFGRVLAEDLAQRLPGTTVLSSNGAISAPEDATVEVNLQRMDVDATGALAFAAQAAVEFTKAHAPPVTRTISTSVPVAGPNTAEMVRAMSIATGRLADMVAEVLRSPRTGRKGGSA